MGSALKVYKPSTPGQRGLILTNRSKLYKGKPLKSLTHGKKKTGGRNNLGRITAWKKGGGHKQSYRIIDFKRDKIDQPAEVLRIEYDPNRTSHIALLKYEDGTHSYIIAPSKLAIGDKIQSSNNADIKPGNCLTLLHIPIGTIIHNIELKPGKGAQLVRSAGSYAQLVGKDGDLALVKLRSGELRYIRLNCRAVIGTVSNAVHKNIKIGKAGRNIWKGIRPTVRGVAMNPVDHPLGGGEGKSAGGRHPVTPWGVPTKGKKTRRNKRTSLYIISRRNKKR